MKFYIFLCLFYFSNASGNLQVNITEGTLEGDELKTRLGKSYIAFKGIPYAQPPVGDLRFKVGFKKQNIIDNMIRILKNKNDIYS